MVEHHVEAEDFETDAVSAEGLTWSTHAIGVEDVRMGHYHRFYDEVSDGVPQRWNVVILAPEIVTEVAQRSFTAGQTHLVLAIIAAVFIDRIVGQVHEETILNTHTE